MKHLTFAKGGIHIPENKFTSARTIIDVELPMHVTMMLKQHIGLPAVPIVKRGDHVVRGQKIAEAQGRVSAPVHTPISGTVEKIAPAFNTSGYTEEAIFIKASDQDHACDIDALASKPVCHDWSHLSAADIIGAVADAGIVGLGGATFPTAMKLSPPAGSKVNTLIINAAECEPYLTCDEALMLAAPAEIIEGIKIMMHALDAPKAVIGIENNKMDAYRALCDAARQDERISVALLRTKYPQGGEKQLIKAITGMEVPSGALPLAVGVVLNNVATAYAVYRAVVQHIPLVEKIVTFAGYGNYRVPLGMIISEMPIDCGYDPLEYADVVVGGPMMGKSASTLDAPFEKGTSGITILPKSLDYNPQPCIRCAACVQACPMGLEPYLISAYGRLRRIDDAVAHGVLDCIECGSCNYSCPSARPILDYIRLAKTAHRNRPKK